MTSRASGQSESEKGAIGDRNDGGKVKDSLGSCHRHVLRQASVGFGLGAWAVAGKREGDTYYHVGTVYIQEQQ